MCVCISPSSGTQLPDGWPYDGSLPRMVPKEWRLRLHPQACHNARGDSLLQCQHQRCHTRSVATDLTHQGLAMWFAYIVHRLNGWLLDTTNSKSPQFQNHCFLILLLDCYAFHDICRQLYCSQRHIYLRCGVHDSLM